jgi:hypothetical protein
MIHEIYNSECEDSVFVSRFSWMYGQQARVGMQPDLNQNLTTKTDPRAVLSRSNLHAKFSAVWMSRRTETHFGDVVVLAERLKMIIEVSNTVFVSFASEFRYFFRKLESVSKSLILMEARAS